MKESVRPAQEINPDAGNHHVTSDPSAVAACEAATSASYAAYPYWEARFGARGHAFSASDSGWLVAISSDNPDDHVVRQIAWLGKVLASRGMPRILVERHLRVLARELESVRPGAEGPRRLTVAADRFEQRRAEMIRPVDFARIAGEFDALTGAVTGGVERCGDLIVGAVCDEPDVPGAVGALVDWLGDPDRFTAEWVSAVEHCLEAAYAARIA